MRLLHVVLAAALVSLPASVRAEWISWEATGIITSSIGGATAETLLPPEMFPVGSALTWTITFESTRAASTLAPPIFGGPGVYHYPAGDSLDWSATTTDWSLTGGNNSVLRVLPEGRLILDTSLTGDVRSTLPAGWRVNGFDAILDWSDPFSSLALPVLLPGTGHFQIFMDFRDPAGSGGGRVEGVFTQFQAVPEPSALLLSVIGAVGMVGLRRRRSGTF